jgi:glycosyltransferase involved in cell wall biosynthesis
MRILFLTQIIPYPPDAGPKVKTWHVLRHLAGCGHQVVLASFVRQDELANVPALRQVCAEVHTVPIQRSRGADIAPMLRSQLSGRPFLVERDDLPGMRLLVARLVREQRFDVIHADQLTMAQYALLPRDWRPVGEAGRAWPVTVFDAHNAVWTIVERMFQALPSFTRPLATLEARRVKRYEGMLLTAFDHTLAVTEPDRRALLEGVAERDQARAAERIEVIPIAVDCQALQPVQRQAGSANIMTLGTLHYPPNADGIRWFLNEVFPAVRRQVPQASLTIVGKNPPQDFLQAATTNPQAVRVTGYVPDLQPYLEQAALMVVPVRAGGGMRVRILEAFARGMPVVTTTVGLEGIEAEPGAEVVVADTPEAFAAATVQLLQDEAFQERLAVNGRRLAEARYDWQAVLHKMNRIYPQEAHALQ